MRIAVTGSSGLVGKEAAARLRKAGHTVVECTRGNANIMDIAALEKAFKNCNVVVHCAAILEESAKNIFDVNVKGTENAARAAAKCGAEQFIFLSSVGVYGALAGMKNEASSKEPETDYEKSKAMAEERVLAMQELINVTILRPAIVVGNNAYWKKIIRLAKKGFPIVSGNNDWQMVCVHDLADAIVFCVGREECYGETFIVAERKSRTLLEVVSRIRKELGMAPRPMRVPVWLGMAAAYINSIVKVVPLLEPAYLKRMMRERLYDTTKLKKAGWEAKHDSAECLAEITRAYGRG